MSTPTAIRKTPAVIATPRAKRALRPCHPHRRPDAVGYADDDAAVRGDGHSDGDDDGHSGRVNFRVAVA